MFEVYWFTFLMKDDTGSFYMIAAEERMDALFQWEGTLEQITELTRFLLPYVDPFAGFEVTVCNFDGIEGILQLIKCKSIDEMKLLLNYRSN